MKNDFNQSLAFAAANTLYSDAYQVGSDVGQVDTNVDVSAIAGVGASLAITVQFSQDKVTWIDQGNYQAITAIGKSSLSIVAANPIMYMRFKAVLTGTTPTASLKFFAQAREGAVVGSGSGMGASAISGNQSVYSNDAADFTATPTVGAKTIILSSINSQISDMLTLLGKIMFAKATIYLIDASGKKSALPLTTVAWDDSTKTLTLSDMNAPFATGDLISVSIPGPVKWFDSLNKTNDHVTNHPAGLQAITLSASGLIMTGAGRVRGLIVNTISGGSCLIYDNTAASGTVKMPATVFAGVGPQELFNIECAIGAYLVISGTGTVTILYENA